jgi:hypothetical protein
MTWGYVPVANRLFLLVESVKVAIAPVNTDDFGRPSGRYTLRNPLDGATSVFLWLHSSFRFKCPDLEIARRPYFVCWLLPFSSKYLNFEVPLHITCRIVAEILKSEGDVAIAPDYHHVRAGYLYHSSIGRNELLMHKLRLLLHFGQLSMNDASIHHQSDQREECYHYCNPADDIQTPSFIEMSLLVSLVLGIPLLIFGIRLNSYGIHAFSPKLTLIGWFLVVVGSAVISQKTREGRCPGCRRASRNRRSQRPCRRRWPGLRRQSSRHAREPC